MSPIAGIPFGIGTSIPYSSPFTPYGLAPYLSQGSGILPYATQSYLPSLQSPLLGGYGIGPVQALPQVLQLLQVVPQQLQQVQLLQQQQLLYLQQLLQIVPAQIQQLQQLIQIIPQQTQQLQQWQQPFGSTLNPLASPLSGQLGFGLLPQILGGQVPSHVM